MDFNDAEISNVSSNKTRSMFYCPQAPNFMWQLNDTTFSWIFAAIGAIASSTAILLNALVIIAVKQRKELQRLSNILTSSMAVVDLLAGGVCLPLCVTLRLLVAHQGLAVEHICMLDYVTTYFNYAFYSCSLFHLTMIAWERYVAIRKFMDYKEIVTRSRFKRLALTAWVSAVLTMLPDSFIISAMEGENKHSTILIKFWPVAIAVFELSAVALVVYFYVMVCLGVRKRKLSQICQVNVLMQAKLENRIAMTFALIAAALILSFVPGIAVLSLAEVFPVLRKSSTMWVPEILWHLNPIFNPLIYCYRDRRFRNAVLELLRMKKPEKPPEKGIGAFAALRLANRKALFALVEDVAELPNTESPIHLARSASCDLGPVLDRAHLETHKTAFKRTMSAPSLAKGSSSCDGLQLQQPSIIVITTALIHDENKL